MISETLKRGRQMGYSRSRIVDADNPSRVLALTAGQGVAIGTPPEGLQKMPVERLDVVDSPDMPPLRQVFGCTRRADGNWSLPELSEEVASPDAALHIGPQFVVLETAAMDLAVKTAGTGLLQGISSHVMFMARGKTGPFRAEATALRGAGSMVAVQTTLFDEGADNKPITIGSYQFSPNL